MRVAFYFGSQPTNQNCESPLGAFPKNSRSIDPDGSIEWCYLAFEKILLPAVYTDVIVIASPPLLLCNDKLFDNDSFPSDFCTS